VILGSYGKQHMRILLVEDDPALRRSLAATFREEGYAVDTAGDGEEGLAKANGGVYDAVVLDVMLPLMNGWEVLERMRPDNRVPVLMLTARDTVPDRVKGLDNGADDYLTKPFDVDELLARVRALIRRSEGLSHPDIVIRDIRIDSVRRRVSTGEGEIQLTPMEYSLLEYLAIRKGSVVSRTTLYERLFDESDDSCSNLLDVHVSNIRRKLGADVITTRRGHGYCVEVE